jgi:hypothetical protein
MRSVEQRIETPHRLHLTRVVRQVAPGAEANFQHVTSRPGQGFRPQVVHDPHREVLKPRPDSIA